MKAIIYGEHPIKPHLLAQYKQMQADVAVSASFDSQVFNLCPVQQVVILSPKGKDSESLVFLSELAALHNPENPRVQILLLLQNPNVLHLLQKTDFPAVVNAAFEVWPFTMEEIWARKLAVRMPGIPSPDSPPLDQHPITKGSSSFVHLVISGADSYAWEVAVQAAMVCHFPNYDEKEDSPLRTRISFVSPGVSAFRDAFIASYPELFANSFYRTVNVEEKTSFLHHPQYEGKRMDFVDVEWEFVESSVNHPQMAERLSAWASDGRRQLTLVVCGEEDAANMSTCVSLPKVLFEKKVPIWILQRKHDWTDVPGYSRNGFVYPFGMEDCGLDVSMPMVEMAKLLHYYYTYLYEFQALPTTLPVDAVETAWRNAGPLKMRCSNLYNVMTMAGKMRSLGHKGDDWRKFFALTPEEVETLAKTEHNRWVVERLLSGMRPCDDTERKEITDDIGLKRKFKQERNAHLDLCAFDELLPDETGVDVRNHDRGLTACIPLIVQTFFSRTDA